MHRAFPVNAADCRFKINITPPKNSSTKLGTENTVEIQL
jgi:hypothetical protein